jgi:hypothetical protein
MHLRIPTSVTSAIAPYTSVPDTWLATWVTISLIMFLTARPRY